MIKHLESKCTTFKTCVFCTCPPVGQVDTMQRAELEKVVEAVNLLQESRAPDELPALRKFIFGSGFTMKAIRQSKDCEELRAWWTPALEKVPENSTGGHTRKVRRVLDCGFPDHEVYSKTIFRLT